MAGMNGYPLPNADYPHTIRLVVPVIPNWVRLPELNIGDDFVALIKAWPGNPVGANYVYVAENPGNAVNPDVSWPLVANESVTFRIRNTWELYASATAANSWLLVCVELRRGTTYQ